MVWCTSSGWIRYKHYHQCFHRFYSILYVIWYSSSFTHRSCFASSSYECSHFPCCKYETDCAGSPRSYGKGTTGLEGPLWLSPYHCGVFSQRHCPPKYTPPLHRGLKEVDTMFHWTISHHVEDWRTGVWSSASFHHGINPPSLPCVSTKAVSNRHWQVTRTCID